jgi:hypothetical protein
MLALAVPRQVGAEPQPAGPVPSPEDVAREVGEEGIRRFQSGKLEEAYELFRRAESTRHAPTLVLYMAHCQARLGNLVAAHGLYLNVAREELASDAPLQFQTAQIVARQELRRIAQHISIMRISLSGAEPTQVRVLVDKTVVPLSEIEAYAVEPGQHVVEAMIPGGVTASLTITTAPGATVAVALSLSAPALDRRAAPAAGAAAPPRLVIPAAVSFGLGAAAAVAGTVTGVLSLRLDRDIQSRCGSGGACLVSDRATAAFAGRLADASTGTFTAAGVALVTGAILVGLHARGARERRAPRVGSIGIGAGFGTLAVGGSW